MFHNVKLLTEKKKNNNERNMEYLYLKMKNTDSH